MTKYVVYFLITWTVDMLTRDQRNGFTPFTITLFSKLLMTSHIYLRAREISYIAISAPSVSLRLLVIPFPMLCQVKKCLKFHFPALFIPSRRQPSRHTKHFQNRNSTSLIVAERKLIFSFRSPKIISAHLSKDVW